MTFDAFSIALPVLAVVAVLLTSPLLAHAHDEPEKTPVAAIVTEYRHNSHADIIVSRLLLTYTLDGKGDESPLELVSLYTDQKPANDTSRLLAAAQRFPIYPTIAETLKDGGDELAVDGVLLIGEHGKYQRSETGNTQYPKMRFWKETVAVFKETGRVVPVFMDKHVSDNWEDAKAIYDEAKELEIPLMAGSSVPGTWRKPEADVRKGAELNEIVAITFGSTDHYGFHALEFVQALAEQRKGGETGIVAVQCLTGDAVWKAMDEGVFSRDVFDQAWERLPRHLNGERTLAEAVQSPVLFLVEYEDGLKTAIIELNGAAGEWSGAWEYAGGGIESCQFWTQEARPGMHFTYLLKGVEKMIETGKPQWPVERTLMSSGTLDALLRSRLEDGKRLETPHLNFSYTSDWRWQSPPPPPEGRPWAEQ